ncbi:MAG: glyoxalase/bleomycin resistance protein/dioxygenase [candidate division TM6 bacterium GW2011_GWE2_41_16]|nr:MAG: glyoxalase/bleomycin resistance protein/dioxygenase [candidate division TM6 bacterium GW2011_GWE2_41_16]
MKLTPYITFNGNCREAMTFYRECLGGELMLSTAGESEMAAQVPTEKHNQIMHSVLEKNELIVMAADNLMSSEKLVPGTAITLCINGGPAQELKIFFAKLAVGGKIAHPLEDTFFGLYGSLTDKFGIQWAVQTDEK